MTDRRISDEEVSAAGAAADRGGGDDRGMRPAHRRCGTGAAAADSRSRAGLSPEDAARAIKTFVPPGGRDEYMLFASGGHSGQVHVIGVPSMRLLKTIAVFTPEPWQGYGYGADWSETALADGGNGHGQTPQRQRQRQRQRTANGRPKDPLRWGDAHHPALSETDGKYDGRWLYINDRAHGRIGMVDLSRLPRQADPPGAEPADVARRHLRDARHAVRAHLVEGAGAEGAGTRARGRRVTLDDHLNRYADIYRGYSTFVKVDPEDRPHDPEGELPDRAAALHAGPRRRRQGRQRRLRVHQLLQRRDGDRRHRSRASRRSKSAPRSSTSTTCTSSTGRRPSRSSRPASSPS